MVDTTEQLGDRYTSRLQIIVGHWWSYYNNGNHYESLHMEIEKKTPAEIAVFRRQRQKNNVSQNLIQNPYEKISWKSVFFYGSYHVNGQNHFRPFVIEVLPDYWHIKMINIQGKAEVMRIDFSAEKLTLRAIGSFNNELHFFRSLPDLTTFALCDGFYGFDVIEAIDSSDLTGFWSTSGIRGEDIYTLTVRSKTALQVSAFRDSLRNIKVNHTNIDWNKVGLEAEMYERKDFRALGLIEVLDEAGSIRVIPSRETWDTFGAEIVSDWFTSQDLRIKWDHRVMAIKNCHYASQVAFFVKMDW